MRITLSQSNSSNVLIRCSLKDIYILVGDYNLLFDQMPFGQYPFSPLHSLINGFSIFFMDNKVRSVNLFRAPDCSFDTD